MTNMYFEVSNGYVMDVTKNTPSPIHYGTKTILKGGDSVEFNRTADGIKVVRKHGKEVKVEKLITEDGKYLLMPVYIRPVSKMATNHRKVYGILRSILDERFYLEENNKLDMPYKIKLKIESDVVIKSRYFIQINNSMLRNEITDIERLIKRFETEIDIPSLYRIMENDMVITVNDGVINELKVLMGVSNSRMVV